MLKALIGMACVVTIAAGGLYIGQTVASQERHDISTASLLKALNERPLPVRTHSEVSASSDLRDAW